MILTDHSETKINMSKNRIFETCLAEIPDFDKLYRQKVSEESLSPFLVT